MRKFVVWFREVDKYDLSLVGGKGANLGEMTKAGIPVPNGFIVTAEAYYYALEAAGIKPELRKLFTSLKTSDNEALQSAAKKAQAIIERIKIPDEIAAELLRTTNNWASGLKTRSLQSVHRPPPRIYPMPHLPANRVLSLM